MDIEIANKKRRLNKFYTHNNHYDNHNDNENNEQNEIFILNIDSIEYYIRTNPSVLYVIYTKKNFSENFYNTILYGGIKNCVKKIITSDNVISNYFIGLLDKFNNIFPNCDTIEINSFDNNYENIYKIIDNFCIKNLIYNLDETIIQTNSIEKYNFFFELLLNCSLINIKNIKIINKTKNKYFENILLKKVFNNNVIMKKNNQTNNILLNIKKTNSLNILEYINYIKIDYTNIFDNANNFNQIIMNLDDKIIMNLNDKIII